MNSVASATQNVYAKYVALMVRIFLQRVFLQASIIYCENKKILFSEYIGKRDREFSPVQAVTTTVGQWRKDDGVSTFWLHLCQKSSIMVWTMDV